MKRFYSIEGLRGWLACIVVSFRLLMSMPTGSGPAALQAGQVAVLGSSSSVVFVITCCSCGMYLAAAALEGYFAWVVL